MIDEFRDFRIERYSVSSGIFCVFATWTCTGMACIAAAPAAPPPAEVFPQPIAPAKTAETASAMAAAAGQVRSGALRSALELLPLTMSCDSNMRLDSPVG